MKIWKVWAQNVRRPAGMAIEDVSYKEDEAIRAAIDEIIDIKMDCGEIDFDEDNQDEVLGAEYDRLKTKLETVRFLQCGDYQLEYAEEMPNRPNCCGWD